jgi:hypothetical protein
MRRRDQPQHERLVDPTLLAVKVGERSPPRSGPHIVPAPWRGCTVTPTFVGPIRSLSKPERLDHGPSSMKVAERRPRACGGSPNFRRADGAF